MAQSHYAITVRQKMAECIDTIQQELEEWEHISSEPLAKTLGKLLEAKDCLVNR